VAIISKPALVEFRLEAPMILADLAGRNALRQVHGLPLLDIEVEFARSPHPFRPA
jgi:hypothetical protein